MNVSILYFSGTGNTAFIAKKIYKKLDKQVYDVKISSINHINQEEIINTDLLIFGFPVYACDLPKFIEKKLKILSEISKKGIIIYCTMGIFSGNVIKRASNMFTQKGFKILHYEEIKMPGSDGLVFLKKDSKYVKNVLSTNFNKKTNVNIAIYNVIEKVDEVYKTGISKVPERIPRFSIIGIIFGSLIRLLYGLLEKHLKKKFRVNNSCIQCGKCQDICPSKNIIIKENKIKFLDRCYLCMRCINQCPVEAIQIGKITENKFRYRGPVGNYNP